MASLLAAKTWGIEGPFRSILRIITGFLFWFHGGQKLFGWFGGFQGGGGTAPVGSLPWIAGILEITGGVLIFIGLFTRPVAFVLCGEMAFAYFIIHFPRAFWPIQNGGEVPVLFCFIFLYLFAGGAGPWSVDHLIGKKSPT